MGPSAIAVASALEEHETATNAAQTNQFPTQNFVVPDGFEVALAAGTLCGVFYVTDWRVIPSSNALPTTAGETTSCRSTGNTLSGNWSRR